MRTWNSSKALWKQHWSDHVGSTTSAIPAWRAIAACLGTALIIGSGCKKPQDELGLSLLDPADTLGTVSTDTTAITAWTKPDAAVRTSALSTNQVGSYVDDVFGPVAVGTATQVRLSINNVGPADPALVCDSLVLSLAYATTDGLYGDPDPQVVSVFRLGEDLHTDSVYKSDRQPVVENNDLVAGAPRLFTPAPTSGPVVGGDTLVPQLRIPLNVALGQELLSQWGQPTMADNASFLAWFKGLAIAPGTMGQAPLQGGVMRLNLLNGASKLTLYFHNNTGTLSTFDFIIGSSSVRYSYVQFAHDQAVEPGLAQTLADTTLGQVETYVQAMGGLRTKLHFPHLLAHAHAGQRALAKAELVVPIAGPFHGTYLPPAQLFVFRQAEDGSDLLVPDQIAGQGMVGGFYNAEKQEYRFNLTRWVQGVLNGTYPNTGLSLVPGSNGVSVNRVRLSGPQRTERPLQLLLTFTTY